MPDTEEAKPTEEAVKPWRPWYTSTAYDKAEISFDDRCPGTVVEISDCTAENGERIKKAIVLKPDGSIEIPIEALAEMVRGHVVAVRGEKKGEIFPQDFPPKGAKTEDFVSALKKMKQKDLYRLREGLWKFRVQEIEQGND